MGWSLKVRVVQRQLLALIKLLWFILVIMVERGFLFHRPVAPSSAKELHEIAHEVLDKADFIDIIPPERLHLSLFHLGMLSCRDIPSTFIYNYSVYDANRSSFSTYQTAPWEEVNIATTGVKALRNSIVIIAKQDYWLRKERKNVIGVSQIPKRKLSFANNAYNPHISLGKFIGELKDIEGFYECEKTLAKALDSVKTVTLEPLRLEYDQHSWVFHSRFAQPAPEPNNNELASA